MDYKGFACLQELVEDKKNEEEAEQVKCNWLCWNDKVGPTNWFKKPTCREL